MKNIRITPEKIEAIKRLYAETKNAYTTAVFFGITYSNVLYHVDPDYKQRLNDGNKIRYAERKGIIASLDDSIGEARPPAPAPVIIETFGIMPPWPKPEYLRSFEERVK